MSKITKIEILNYKSIKKLSIPFDKDYGNSKTVFLLGINESGKSNILEALNQVKNGFKDEKFQDVCHKSEQDKEDVCVAINIHMEIEESNVQFLKKKIANEFECFRENADKLIFTKNAIRTISLRKNNECGNLITLDIGIDNKFPFNQWRIEGEGIVPINQSEEFDSNHITKDELKNKLCEFTNTLVGQEIPGVVYWQPRPEYLIDKPISLTGFKENINSSIPLKNIFFIYGKNTQQDIAAVIDSALGNAEKKSELEDKLSTKVTSHIKAIWKEHKIGIKIKIDGEVLNVHIEDADQKHSYYNMSQRSDGFKQFISLLLTLSSQYKSGILKNNIILLDEPEAHLHPSGIQFMRDEILKIGQDNHMFVATHSPSMVDRNSIERHWIVSKSKMKTDIHFLEKGVKEFDEKILMLAFGISILKDLLPKNLLLVEGQQDKKLIRYAIDVLNKGAEKSGVTIKSAGGASKLYPIASLLNQENINAYILCDSDRDGKQCVQKIREKLQGNFSSRNVFTLRDLENTLPKNATIEDTLPLDFVISFCNDNGYKIDQKQTNLRILFQLIKYNQNLKGDEEAQNKFKRDLANAFIEQEIKEGGCVFAIATKLINKINDCNQ